MTGKRFGLLAASGGVMALVLVACGADPTATPTSAPAAPPPAQATPTPDAVALFQVEWDALIEAAQEEGELTIAFGGGAGRNYRPITDFFSEKFGIDVVIATGGGAAHVDRVLAEQINGRYLVDAMYSGPTPFTARMIPANALIPIADLFIHPEVTDLSLWYKGKHWYSDPPQQFVFAFAASAGPENMGMQYNTDLVSQEDIDAMNSVFDFLDPKWKGKIVSHSPVRGGSSGTYFKAYVHPDIGPEWIDRFLSPELDVLFTEDTRFITDAIAKGKYSMAVAAGGLQDLEALATLGVPVKKLVKEFKEGGSLSSTSSTHNVVVPINQPHPNATKLWINWFLSQEGQTLTHTIVEVLGEPTFRVDVTDWGKTNPLDRRVEGKSYYSFGTNPELVAKRQEAGDYVTAVWDARP